MGKPVSSMIQASTRPAALDRRQHQFVPPCPASRRPTTAHYQQNEARIDAWQRPVPVPSRPPSVRRSCGQSASTAPGSNHASAAVDRHDPAQPRAPRHRPQIALHSPRSIRVHSGPPIRMKIAPITTSCGCQREKIHDLEFCDSVRLGVSRGPSGAERQRQSRTTAIPPHRDPSADAAKSTNAGFRPGEKFWRYSKTPAYTQKQLMIRTALRFNP